MPCLQVGHGCVVGFARARRSGGTGGAQVAWVLLAAAIATELVGTLGLRQMAAAGGPSVTAVLVVAVSYAASFVTMSLALRQLNVGVVYAVWSGAGTAAVAVIGALVFGDRLNWQGCAGLVLIVVGVVVLVTSGAVSHG